MEVVGLRKKNDKNESFVKFKDNSVVLDKILDFQRSPLDKTSLGYKKEKKKSEDDTWSPKTPEVGPSMSKVDPYAPAHENKDFGSSKMKQGVRSVHQRKQLQDPGMKVASMVIVIFVLTLVIRLWSVGSMEEEGLEVPMSQLDVGHVNKSDM